MCIRDRAGVAHVRCRHDDDLPVVGGVGEGFLVAGHPRGEAVSYTHLRAHETVLDLVCRLLLEKKKNYDTNTDIHTTISV